jgi:hypothetical protein
MTLNAKDRTRLIQLLGMLGSDHDGECCNAARLACRLLRTHGLTWEQALQASDGNDERGSLWDQAFAAGYRAGREWKPPTWREVAKEMLDYSDLDGWERDFLSSFLDQGRESPTPRQETVFRRVAERCGMRCPGEEGD